MAEHVRPGLVSELRAELERRARSECSGIFSVCVIAPVFLELPLDAELASPCLCHRSSQVTKQPLTSQQVKRAVGAGVAGKGDKNTKYVFVTNHSAH